MPPGGRYAATESSALSSAFIASGACANRCASISPMLILSYVYAGVLCSFLFRASPLVRCDDSFESFRTDALLWQNGLQIGIYRCREVAIAVLFELLLLYKII